MSKPLLDIRDLRVTFHQQNKAVKAVDGVNLTIGEGEVFGLVGESGSGKSVSALSVMRLLNAAADVQAEWIRLEGRDLISLSEKEMRKIRGDRISMIFQDPMTSLNPSITVGNQIEESIMVHRGVSRAEARSRACDMMDMLAIPDPKETRERYPHEFSGGMRQRVMIAMALCCDPDLLIADEPTTALDVTIQAQILDLIKDLVRKLQVSVLLITHDFGVVAELCEKVSVMYAGNIVEHAPLEILLEEAEHPYTRGLLSCIIPLDEEVEKLEIISGLAPDPTDFPSGCRFHPRCDEARKLCSVRAPTLREIKPGHLLRCHL